MRWYLWNVLFILSALTSACSLDARIGEIVKMEATFINNAVAANQKAYSIENGYLVQGSGGSITDGDIEITHTGYTVYLSTQTVLLSQ